ILIGGGVICVADVAAHRQAEELAYEMIFEAGADNLALVVEIFGSNEAYHAIHNERIEDPRDTIGACLKSELIDALMSFSRKRAALARFEIHGLRALPFRVTRAMMLESFFAAFAQRRERDAKAAIRRFGACDGLEEQVHGRAAIHGGELGADVCEAADLCGYLVGFHQTIQCVKDRADHFHGIRGGIHADHRVTASVKQTLKSGQENSA